jgi:tetratricopeptide (TPR) repeat protein
VLVGGEPGIGKTALVAAAATEARRSGFLVLSGACWDGDSPPGYWPWVQVFRALQRATPETWSRLAEVGGDTLARLLGDTSTTASSEDPTFQLCDTISRTLLEAAQRRPVVVALDDLHWADAASIRVLDFLVRHLALEPLLIIATYRNVELDAEEHPLRSSLLALLPKATPILLGGLDLDSTALLIGQAADRQPEASLVADLQRTTGGNPFFVQQAALLWAANSSMLAITPAVREAVERRLARLETSTVDVLTWAATLGYDFDTELLAAASERSRAEAEHHMSVAAAARLVVASGADHFRFVHDLVRQTLTGMLDEERVRALHATIVRAICSSKDLRERALPGQLADHAYLAVPSMNTASAVGLLVAAAQHASARLAADEACLHYSRALELVPPKEANERMGLLLALGLEQQRSGHMAAARKTLESALQLADESENSKAFAQAALGLHALGEVSALDAGRRPIELLDDAYARLSAVAVPDNTGLRARLAAAASQARTHQIGEDRAFAQQLSARAVDLARQSGEDGALGFCLLAQHDALWEPGTASKRVAIADTMLEVAHRSGNRELELQAALLRIIGLLERGDPRALDQQATFADATERSGLVRFRYLALSRRATICTLQGNFDQARQYMDEALALGQRIGEADAFSVRVDQVWELERLRGNTSECARLIGQLIAEGWPHTAMVEAMLALDTGDPNRARSQLEGMEALGLRWPRWAATTHFAFRAELASATREPDLIAAARASLAPLLDDWVVLAGAVVVHGPIAYWAALLDQAEQRWEDAIGKFELARQSAERLSARPWSIRAELGLAECLLQRGASADIPRASALLNEVESAASELGMVSVIRRLGDARKIVPPSTSSATEDIDNVWRFDGQVWTLRFGERSINVPDAKGLHDLRQLLSQPGSAIPVERLIDPQNGLVPHRMGADSTIDELARAAYRQRLEELGEDVNAALREHDDERAGALDREREALISELRAATGLGGRRRRLGDDSERARKTISARIRDTLRHLEGPHPQLANHLRRSVSMGATCCYDPAERIRWRT